MKHATAAALASGLALTILAGAPAYAVEVKQEVKVKASPADVWRRIGPFCAINGWHPAVTACERKREGRDIVRVLTLKDGGKITEKLTAEDRFTYSYVITDSPLPVKDYKATIAVKAAADGDQNASTVIWSSTFEPKDKPEAAAKSAIEGIFKAGLENIQTQIKTEAEAAGKAQAERAAKINAIKLAAMEKLAKAKAKAVIADKAKKVADEAKEAYEKAKAQLSAVMKK